jgi:hypothetical protein
MGGTVGVLEKTAGVIRSARAQLQAGRRRREARRLARDAAPRRGALVTRRWIEAEIAARIAVRSGVRADDFLRARLARYASALQLPLESLGVAVSFQDGEPVIHARATSPATPPGSDAPRHARQLEEARAEATALAERVTTTRARLDATMHTVSDDLASGKLPANPELLEASPEQRGRPPVPALAPQLLLGGLSVALLTSAAYRMAVPAFALAGLSPDLIAEDLARDAVSTVAALLFGVGAAVAVFAFLHVAADRGRELLLGTSPARRPAVLGLAGGVAIALATVVALSAVRPGLLAGPVLLLMVALGAVFLARQARRLAVARAAATSAALEWDREQARGAVERARRGESISRLEAALATAARELEAAERRLRALEQQSMEETREAEVRVARTALSGERLAESLAAALELDRYAFVRRAAALAQGAADVRPLRSRPSPVDPAVRGPLEAAG